MMLPVVVQLAQMFLMCIIYLSIYLVVTPLGGDSNIWTVTHTVIISRARRRPFKVIVQDI